MDTYFNERILGTLGLTNDYLTLNLKNSDNNDVDVFAGNGYSPTKIIQYNKFGDLELYPYDLSGQLFTWDDSKAKSKVDIETARVIRFNPNREGGYPENAEGEAIKNSIKTNKEIGCRALIPPNLYRHYKDWEQAPDKKKHEYHLDTIYLVEGYLKAIKADFEGLNGIIGLSSINHVRIKYDGIHHPIPEIEKIINNLNVKNIVLLHDGDARKMNFKPAGEDAEKFKVNDLTKRATTNFIPAVKNTFNTYKPLITGKFYYLHINEATANKGKGLDDLICHYQQHEGESGVTRVLNDLKGFGDGCRFFENLVLTKQYLHRELYKHFKINNLKSFYNFYGNEIPEGEFWVFKGSVYKLESDENDNLQPILQYDAFLERFIMVGDCIYEKVPGMRNAGNDLDGNPKYVKVELLIKRSISALRLRFPKHFRKGQLSMAEKIAQFNFYQNFSTQPGHHEYYEREIIPEGSGREFRSYNLYKPLTIKPLPFDYKDNYDIPELKNTLQFLRHLFADDSKEKVLGNKFELILDYLTISLRYPTSKLPIIVLFSKERGTGKSTFLDYLTMLFGQNAMFITGSDFTSNFNADWIGSSHVLCDEAFFEKAEAIEKIKFFSTGTQSPFEIKGAEKGNVPIHMKIVMCTNKKDFARIDKEEVRFWISEVKSLNGNSNPDFRVKLKNEIPHFLHYLYNRTILHPNHGRMWFEYQLYETEILKEIKRHTKTYSSKGIADTFKTIFYQLTNKQDLPEDLVVYFPMKLTDWILTHENDRSLKKQQVMHKLMIDYDITKGDPKNVSNTIELDQPTFYDRPSLDGNNFKVQKVKKRNRFYKVDLRKFLSKEDLKEIDIAKDKKQPELPLHVNNG